jgi:cytochrome P450 family 4
MIAEKEKWFARRKIITPTFHFKILEQFVEIFDKQSNTLVEKLRKYKDQAHFDIFDKISLFALDVINETAMGVTIDAQNKADTEYVRAVQE